MTSKKSGGEKVISIKEAYATMLNARALGIRKSYIAESSAALIAEKIKCKKAVIACGTGGKGKIGYALARNLSSASRSCDVYIASFITKNVGTIKKPRWIEDSRFIEVEKDFESFRNILKNADCVIDAIIGIGINREPEGVLKEGIKEINKCKNIISIDVPTGIYADTGALCKEHIKATKVFAIYRKKQAMLCKGFPNTEIIDPGIPKTLDAFAGPGDLLLASKPLPNDANKYSHGCVLVVGGGEVYHGAPIAASNATNSLLTSLRVGAGYVSMFLPKELEGIAKKLSANSIVRSFKSYDELPEKIKYIRHDSLVIGMGIKSMSSKILEQIIRQENSSKRIVVVDGGAIEAARGINLRNNIITPHEGEFYKISGIKPSKDIKKRIEEAKEFANEYGGTIVLKGHQTIITDGSRIKINTSKSPALATMGTGDVLAGMIGAYAAISKKPFESAVAGVYAHAAIGDMLYRRKGNHLLASDIIDEIPHLLKKYDKMMSHYTCVNNTSFIKSSNSK